MRQIYFILAILVAITAVSAYPPISTEIYGVAKSSNFNVTAGTTVEVLDQDGTVCGTFEVETSGGYGLLTCAGDDPETAVDEGATAGEELDFRIDGQPAKKWNNVTFQSGTFQAVNISIPVPVCGDNLCDLKFEDSFSCPADCELGNATTNETGNVTSNETSDSEGSAGGGSGAGGGGGGAGSGGGGGGGGGGGAAGGGFFTEAPQQICEENWNCTEWSECNIEGVQTRTCTDENSCGTEEDKPSENTTCEYIPTCFDGIKNGMETDIDCGGPCGSCSLGQTCEEHDDCISDYCIEDTCRVMSCDDPGLFCSDGLRNCGEQGLDCGGPCDNSCPKVERPVQIIPFVCEKEVNPIDNNTLIFFIIMLMAVVVRWATAYYKIKEIDEDLDEEMSENKEVEVLESKFSIKRKSWSFTAAVIIVTIVLYAYYYFFIQCETPSNNIWWLVGFLFISPAIVHYIMNAFEYREKEHIRRLQRVNDEHYRQIMKLIEIENRQLEEMEKEVSELMRSLMDSREFKESLDKYPNFKRVYSDMVDLYLAYANKDTPYGLEKELCQEIYELETNEGFQKLAEEHPEIKGIYNRLRFLYEQYEHKQELYDDLDRIEEGWKAEEKQEPKESEDKEDDSDEEEMT